MQRYQERYGITENEIQVCQAAHLEMLAPKFNLDRKMGNVDVTFRAFILIK